MNEEFIDSILTSLNIIGKVQLNEKLCIRKGYLQIDKVSKFQFLKRFLFNDSRDNTLNYLKQLIRNIKMVLETDRELVINEFDTIIMGINNLKITYSDDPMIIASFDHIVTKLKKLINN